MSHPPTLDYAETPLPKLERRMLAGYLKYRTRPPTLGWLILRSWKSFLILGLAGLWGAVIMAYFVSQTAALIIAAMILGAMTRDIGIFRVFVRVWPTLEKVLDWRRVEELANQGIRKNR